MNCDEAITAIKTWEECMRKSNKCNDFATEFIDAAVMMCNVLNQEGEWYDHMDFEECSVCKTITPKRFETNCGRLAWIRTPYCPYCGVKMRT